MLKGQEFLQPTLESRLDKEDAEVERGLLIRKQLRSGGRIRGSAQRLEQCNCGEGGHVRQGGWIFWEVEAIAVEMEVVNVGKFVFTPLVLLSSVVSSSPSLPSPCSFFFFFFLFIANFLDLRAISQ